MSTVSDYCGLNQGSFAYQYEAISMGDVIVALDSRDVQGDSARITVSGFIVQGAVEIYMLFGNGMGDSRDLHALEMILSNTTRMLILKGMQIWTLPRSATDLLARLDPNSSFR